MILIIGAGPAGLGAAKEIASHGVHVTVIDSAPRMGGQYWRHRTTVTGYKSARSQDYFSALSENSFVTFIFGAQVWSGSSQGGKITLNYIKDGIDQSIAGEKLIIATGAYDRTLPFPGWDKAGVMTAGGSQALLKGQGVLPGKRIVISGTGPFLLPVATGLAEAGAEVVAILEANSPLRWALSPAALLRNPGKLLELIYYFKKLREFSLKPRFGSTVTSFEGGVAQVARIDSQLRIGKKTPQSIECDVVAIGWGFTPDVTIGGIFDCKQTLAADNSVVFEVDSHQKSSVPGIWIAGEATGVGGADLALIEGEIAGRSVCGYGPTMRQRFTRSNKKSFARALLRSYPIRKGWLTWLRDDSLLCRCEEVSLGDIHNSVIELGADDVRTAKLFTRAGMGLCQGRVCARNVSDAVSSVTGCPISEQSRIASSNRPISAPITLGQLARGKKS